jgi:hypothetical protein
MKKLLLTLMLAVVSSSAMAEWVAIGTTDNSTHYANPNTIRKSGNKVKIWTLTDFNAVEEHKGDKFLSIKAQEQYDCKEEQRRLLYFSRHSENMGGGGIVYSDAKPDKSWRPIPPDSVAEMVWKFACGK